MEFEPYLNWVDVEDPANPPAGARKIMASDLLRYENGLVAAAAEVGSADDAAVAAHVEDPDSQTRGALNATYASQPQIDTTAGTKVTFSGYVIYYVSGSRDISALWRTDQGWAAKPAIFIFRDGPNVTVNLSGLYRTTAGSGYQIVVDIPLGFRPRYNEYPTTGRGYRAYIPTSGALQVLSPGVSTDYLSWTYLTADPEPSVLPGTPA